MKFNFYNIQWTKTQNILLKWRHWMDDIVTEEKYKMLLRIERVNWQFIIEKNCDLEMIRSDHIKQNCKLHAWPAAPWTGYDDVSLLTHSSQFTENIKTIQLNNFLWPNQTFFKEIKREDNRSNVAPPLFFFLLFSFSETDINCWGELQRHQHRSMQNKKDLPPCANRKKKKN